MECSEDSSVSHEDIPCNSDPCEVDYNSILVGNTLSLKGKAQLLDGFLCHHSKTPRQENPWKRRVEIDNIVFRHENA
jgi:hypothetical protein